MFLWTSVYSNMIILQNSTSFPLFPPADKLLHLTALLELQYGSACSVTNII